MSQTVHKIINPNTVWADNLAVAVGTSETIVLDTVPFLGYAGVSLVVSNTGASNITGMKLYASADGYTFFDVTSLFTTPMVLPITPGSTKWAFGTVAFLMLRVTLTAAGATTADVHLVGVDS